MHFFAKKRSEQKKCSIGPLGFRHVYSTDYDAIKTTTFFRAVHDEGDTYTDDYKDEYVGCKVPRYVNDNLHLPFDTTVNVDNVNIFGEYVLEIYT